MIVKSFKDGFYLDSLMTLQAGTNPEASGVSGRAPVIPGTRQLRFCSTHATSTLVHLRNGASGNCKGGHRNYHAQTQTQGKARGRRHPVVLWREGLADYSSVLTDPLSCHVLKILLRPGRTQVRASLPAPVRRLLSVLVRVLGDVSRVVAAS